MAYSQSFPPQLRQSKCARASGSSSEYGLSNSAIPLGGVGRPKSVSSTSIPVLSQRPRNQPPCSRDVVYWWPVQIWIKVRRRSRSVVGVLRHCRPKVVGKFPRSFAAPMGTYTLFMSRECYFTSVAGNVLEPYASVAKIRR